MKVVIGNDHAGLPLKDEVIEYLKEKEHEIINVGVDTEDPADYPDMAKKACEIYLNGQADFGIVLCGTGIGISIAANKIKKIRCALIYDLHTAQMARAHNEANFIALGGRIKYAVPVRDLLDQCLKTAPSGGRHSLRVDKIRALEKT